LLAEERMNAICEIVNRQGAATVTELAEELDISESTIRRDLIALDGSSRLRKVRGGATSLRDEFIGFEKDIATKSEQNMPEKRRIGAYAASLVYNDDFVFLDAGTTTLCMAEELRDSKATFITNGLLQAEALSRFGCRVYLLGGELKATTGAIVGMQAVRSLQQYNFTKCFLGVNGITRKQGVTTADPEEAMLKRTVSEQSFVSYALADSTKFNTVYAVQIVPLNRVCILTDHLTEPSLAEYTVIKEVP
jgi:DeoR family fructose operon transcriptional repressor